MAAAKLLRVARAPAVPGLAAAGPIEAAFGEFLPENRDARMVLAKVVEALAQFIETAVGHALEGGGEDEKNLLVGGFHGR